MPVPDHIGRFAVGERIGGGAFASVWRAHDDALDSTVAIKVLSENWLDAADVRRRFLAEAKLLRKAESDRLVRVHDIGELPDGRPYLVMTFADRGTLDDRLTDGPLPWRTAVATAIELAEALRVLHGYGVLHRDMKPSNVLFRSRPDGRDQVMLGDLGLGKLLSEASTLTMAGGTPAYMAPEQARFGDPVSVRTDVYGLGALLYRCLTGRNPHDLTEFAAIADPNRPPPAAPGSVVPDIPAALDKVVLRALRNDPGERPADAGELAADLRRVLDESAPTFVEEQPPARSAVRRRALLPVALVVLVLVLVGAAVVWYWSTPDEVEASDSTGTLRLRAPRGWAEEITGAGWDPARLGLAGGREPGLVVAASVPAYASDTDTRPGVFAGLVPAAAPLTSETFGAKVTRKECATVDPAGIVVTGVLAANRHRCGQVFLDDVLLQVSGRQVWVQVKQPTDDVEAARTVLGSVHVG